jgi:hypothetical protein
MERYIIGDYNEDCIQLLGAFFMFHNFDTYYHQNVVLAFEDYRTRKNLRTSDHSRDLRAALDAATALFHLREHLPQQCSITRSQTEKACHSYALLGDIVNAAKHRTLSQTTPHGTPLISDAAQLKEVLISTEYEDKDGKYRDTEKVVMVTLHDGTHCEMLDVLVSVINFWESYLAAHGVLTQARIFQGSSSNHPKARADCAQQMDFRLTKGLPFQMSIYLQLYNYQTKKVEPIDLTGASAEMMMHKPSYEVDVMLKNHIKGISYKRTIQLTKEESLAMAALSNDDERQKLLSSFSSAQKAMQELMKTAAEDERNSESAAKI